MSTGALNLVNAGLMVVACVGAFALPFHLFLLAYSVLGPLHYLTQISWLHDRGYFTRRRMDAPVLLGLTVLAVVAPFTASSPVQALQRSAPVVCVAFAGAIVMAFTSSALARVLVALAGLLAVTGQVSLIAIILFGFFLSTLLHVFVFTALFILVGSLKTRSISGLVSLAVLLICGGACLLVSPGAPGPEPGPYVRTAYGPFIGLNAQFVSLLGWPPLRTLDDLFQSPAGVAAMRFIAFAYTYHYLNWFSKTKVIGWADIPRWRTVAIVAAWVASVSCYYIDYRFGFVVLLGLSLLHVVLEFPLDHVVLVDVARQLGALARPGLTAAPVTASVAARERRHGRGRSGGRRRR